MSRLQCWHQQTGKKLPKPTISTPEPLVKNGPGLFGPRIFRRALRRGHCAKPTDELPSAPADERASPDRAKGKTAAFDARAILRPSPPQFLFFSLLHKRISTPEHCLGAMLALLRLLPGVGARGPARALLRIRTVIGAWQHKSLRPTNFRIRPDGESCSPARADCERPAVRQKFQDAAAGCGLEAPAGKRARAWCWLRGAPTRHLRRRCVPRPLLLHHPTTASRPPVSWTNNCRCNASRHEKDFISTKNRPGFHPSIPALTSSSTARLSFGRRLLRLPRSRPSPSHAVATRLLASRALGLHYPFVFVAIGPGGAFWQSATIILLRCRPEPTRPVPPHPSESTCPYILHPMPASE